jgi:antitoxin MazE
MFLLFEKTTPGIIIVYTVDQGAFVQTQISKWGNSLAIRIPKSFAEEIHLEADTPVELSLEDGKLVIKPLGTPKWTLEELLAGVTDDNIHQEIGTGLPMGKELW